MPKLSDVPATVLEWTPVWFSLRRQDEKLRFVRLADETRWDTPLSGPAANPATEGSSLDQAALTLNIPLKSYFSPALVRMFVFALAAFKTLELGADHVPDLRTEYSAIWMVLAAIGLAVLYASVEVFVAARRQLISLFPSKEARLQALRDAEGSCRVRVKSITAAAITALFVAGGGLGQACEAAQPSPQVRVSSADLSIEALEKAGIVQQKKPEGEGPARKWVLTFSSFMIDRSQSWRCGDFNDANAPAYVIWELAFPPETLAAGPEEVKVGLTSDNRAAWRGGHALWHVFTLPSGEKVRRKYFSSFVTTKPAHWSAFPPDLRLRVAEAEGGLKIEDVQTLPLILRAQFSTRCAVRTGEELLILRRPGASPISLTVDKEKTRGRQ